MMIETYYIYYGLVIICFILAYAEQHNIGMKKNFWLFLLIILYSLVIGFKYSMGADFEAYLSHYQRVYDGNEYETYFDQGYLILNRVLAFFRVPPVYFFVFLNFVTFSSVTFISKKAYPEALPWAISIFIMMDYGMSLSTNVYRQYVALSCLTFVLPLALLKTHKILFVLGCILAGQFHASAIIGIVYLLFVDKNILNTNNRLLFVIFIGILYFIGSLILPYFIGIFQTIANAIGLGDRSYLDGSFRVELGSGIGVLLKFFQASLALWLYPIIRKEHKDDRLMNLIFNGYLFGNIIKPLFFPDIVLLRTLAPFLIFEYIVVGWTAYFCFKNKNLFLLGVILVLSYIVLFYSYISGSINWMSPYIPFPNNYGY